MLLTELPKLISCKKIYNVSKKKISFNSIYTNSKNIKKYSILAILENNRFKNEYIKEAINNGALAIITKKILTVGIKGGLSCMIKHNIIMNRNLRIN